MTIMSPAPNRRSRVLVVDDSPAFLASLCELLNEDHEVIFATSGQEAIDMAHSQNPDLILLDAVMPEMDGFEVCSRLKLSPRTLDIPVVFITSMSEELDYLQGLKVGAIDYIQKPINPEVVRARVKNLIQVKRKQDNVKGLTILDALTGIANRRRFDMALRKEWTHAASNQTQLSLIMIDTDYFKIFNDTYGYIAGDACLCKIAEALSQSLMRPMGLVARFRDEEFVCLLPGMDSDGALLVAEHFREAVAALAVPHKNSPAGPTVTLSQGVATMVPGADTPSDLLLVEADRQLYEARRNGRNRIERSATLAGSLFPLSGTTQEKGRPELPTILLVEDDQNMRAILAGRLAFLPANVKVVTSAEEALNSLTLSRPREARLGWPNLRPQRRMLNIIDRSKPQLVLSDVVMSGIDGFSLCERVKKNSTLRNIPFVLLTSLDLNLHERSILAGADDYLSKVEDDQVFRMRTRFLLELGTLHAAGAVGSSDVEGSTVYLCSGSTTIQKQMEDQLLPAGIRVHPVSSLTALMQDLQLRMPDVLVLDLDPDQHAALQDCLARLWDLPECADLPVLLLASKGEEARMLPLEGFITDRLLKPLEAQEAQEAPHRLKLLVRLVRARRNARIGNP